MGSILSTKRRVSFLNLCRHLPHACDYVSLPCLARVLPSQIHETQRYDAVYNTNVTVKTYYVARSIIIVNFYFPDVMCSHVTDLVTLGKNSSLKKCLKN